MKFISKNLNLRIVLRPGVEGNRLSGDPAKPGLYARFEDGMLNADDKETCEMLLGHPGFNSDFFRIEEGDLDPYAGNRKQVEHEHDIVEIEYGHIGKNVNPKKPQLTPEMHELVKSMAKEIASQIAPEMAKDLVKQALAEVKDTKSSADEGNTQEKPKTVKSTKKAGSPKKSAANTPTDVDKDEPEKTQE
jgi:hypothetical protein